MDDAILTWNFPNWVTVTLMAAIGFFVLGWVKKTLASRQTGA